MSRRGQWIVVGSVAGALVLALALAVALAPPPVGIGGEAPAFRAVNLATGDTVAFRDYRGHVVVLNLWATWCVPCEAEMPEFQRLHEALGPEGLKIVAVSEDERPTSAVQEWVTRHRLTFDVLHDQQHLTQDLYRAVGLPETFVIDPEGNIVKRITGHVLKWDDPTQVALLRRLLKRNGAR